APRGDYQHDQSSSRRTDRTNDQFKDCCILL
ncbi:unnamed protein product, partial [Rotaria sp. Silwood2]